jgi:hypothetical protein
MNDFQPNLVEFGDTAGLGMWEDGHFRQHENYVQALIGKGFFIPTYPILHFVGLDEQQLMDWLNLHEALHAGLRGITGVTGTDLSILDPKSPDAWENWQQVHRFEHFGFDQVLGLGVN